jgi:predicted NUDIX family NTP pyrophosphohydrolase
VAKSEVLRVHASGLFWHNKNEGAWLIPRARPLKAKNWLNAAKREFQEETGCTPMADGMNSRNPRK